MFELIEEAFEDQDNVIVRLVAPSTTEKSLDLEQDYDPDSSDLHKVSGVIVRTAQREYFFPQEWAANKDFNKVHKLVDEIRAFLESC